MGTNPTYQVIDATNNVITINTPPEMGIANSACSLSVVWANDAPPLLISVGGLSTGSNQIGNVTITALPNVSIQAMPNVSVSYLPNVTISVLPSVNISTIPGLTTGSNTIGSVNQAGIWNVGVIGGLPVGANVIGSVTQYGNWSVNLNNGLPTGSNSIGSVLVTSLPTGTNSLGSVAISSLPASSNVIGSVTQSGVWTVSLNAYSSVSPSTAPSKAVVSGGTFFAAGITLTDGQSASHQFDQDGNLKVAGSFSANTTAFATSNVSGVNYANNTTNILTTDLNGQLRVTGTFQSQTLSLSLSGPASYTNNTNNPIVTDLFGQLKTVANVTSLPGLTTGSNQIGSVLQSGSWTFNLLNGLPTGSNQVGNVSITSGNVVIGGGLPAGTNSIGSIVITSLPTGANIIGAVTQSGAWLANTNADGPINAGAAPSKSFVVGGVYNNPQLTLANGQAASLQFDTNGNLKTTGSFTALTSGIATSGNPTYTNATANSLSMDLAGNLRVAGTFQAQTYATATSNDPTYTNATSNALSVDLSGHLRTVAIINNISAGLASGANQIGNVNITSGNVAIYSLPTGANIIGSVIINSLPAGANQIGTAISVGPTSTNTSKVGNPVQQGHVYNSTQPTIGPGNIVEAQATARGGLIVATGIDVFNVNAAQGGVWTINAISSGLPTGSNSIGNVSVTALPSISLSAGSNQIGNVSITTHPGIATGSNQIGNVSITAMPTLTLGGLSTGTNSIGNVSITTLPGLPSGANQLGYVSVTNGSITIASLPSGANLIGNVSISAWPTLALATSTNSIGNVNITNYPPLPVGNNIVGNIKIVDSANNPINWTATSNVNASVFNGPHTYSTGPSAGYASISTTTGIYMTGPYALSSEKHVVYMSVGDTSGTFGRDMVINVYWSPDGTNYFIADGITYSQLVEKGQNKLAKTYVDVKALFVKFGNATLPTLFGSATAGYGLGNNGLTISFGVMD